MNDSRLVTPALYAATVAHTRTERLRHSFRYGTFMWLVDVDDLPDLPWLLRPFARFRSKDHSGDPSRGLHENIRVWLDAHGVDLGSGRVVMLTNAAVLGHVFNPISLYWCFGADGTLHCTVAEVHNTYGGRHRYLLRTDTAGRTDVPKELYVSPFFPVDGRYTMHVPLPARRLALSVQLWRPDGGGERLAFAASLSGRRRSATTFELLKLLIRYPLPTLRVTALIRFQGIRLWLRGLRVEERPAGHAREEQR